MLIKRNKKNESGRKISIWRLLLLIAIVVGGMYATYNNRGKIHETIQNEVQEEKENSKPWYGPYVDVTATPQYEFEQVGDEQHQPNLVLAFIVSDQDAPCTPTWGNAYTLEEANLSLDLDRRIARFRQKGGHVAISFGGLINDELSVRCDDKDQLLSAYKEVIDRYGITTIDLDIEGESMRDNDSLKRRAEVIANLQTIMKDEDKNLAVWLTLPVAPFGMTEDGTNVVSTMLSSGVDLAGVNLMTMDYGESKDENMSMGEASKRALIEAHRQLGILYEREGINLTSSTLWSKIGATPMIGQNDIVGEIFTLDDAINFNEFTLNNGISRMSMWSANRDIQCGENYVNLTVVSDSCSGVKQEKYNYSMLLGNNFEGRLDNSAGIKTISEELGEVQEDIPEESPYPIWSESATYLEGTKVVWHRNVYQAKWWTQGDSPDNPVLQSWETPWQLIGPVLPGEKPIPQPTLPEGTFPQWYGEAIYEDGAIVLFNEIPYKAKWWTQGDSPAAAGSNPDVSPWKALTKEEIDQIIINLGLDSYESTDL